MSRQHSTFNAHANLETSTVSTRGELNVHGVDLLAEAIDLLVHAGKPTITVDLAEVTAIDATGTRTLAALQHSLSTHSGDLILVNAAPEVFHALTHAQLAVEPLTGS